jgi:hypothetical protein
VFSTGSDNNLDVKVLFSTAVFSCRWCSAVCVFSLKVKFSAVGHSRWCSVVCVFSLKMTFSTGGGVQLYVCLV